MTQPVGAGSKCGCKVGDVASQLGLTDIDEELVGRWSGDHPEQMSVRELADYFNTRVLKKLFEESDTGFMKSQAGPFYDILSQDPDDEESPQSARRDREELIEDLEESGFDVDKITTDYFVSYQSIYTHLTKCLEVESPSAKNQSENSLANDQDTVRRITAKAAKIGETLMNRNVEDSDDVSGRLEISASVDIRCDECGYKKSLVSFLEDGGCYCSDVHVEDKNSENGGSGDAKVRKESDGGNTVADGVGEHALPTSVEDK